MPNISILLIAGGGSGGSGAGGGGGAGGYQYDGEFSITPQAYSVTVGAGGVAVSSDNTTGNDGNNSVFDSITANGGGGGGWYSGNAGKNGGSGGGGGWGGEGGAGGTGSQGSNGGAGVAGNDAAAGGGGGATATGGNGSVTTGGAGGVGTANSITGSSVTYAGGGGGSGYTANGAGGTGGGGAGNRDGTATSGTANLGGGGGGNDGTGNSGAGGSGVVIIRYLTADLGTCTGGDITTDGDYTVHTFTSNGTFTVILPKTITAKASILNINTQTISALGRITISSEQEIEAITNIKKQTEQTISAKGRIPFPTTITAKASILNINTQTISAKGRIPFPPTKTITAKGNITKTVGQSIKAKGLIAGTTSQTISAKGYVGTIRVHTKTINVGARINPPQLFVDEVNKTVRQISSKLEIQWDGAIWTDETIYLLTARANEKMASDSGAGIASTLDVELDNTTERFSPGNSSSPLDGYIKPRVNIRVSIIMAGYTYRLFTGYIKNIHPDTRSRICSLECYDNQVFIYNKRANGIVYEDARSDQLLSTLSELAGLTENQYIFDIGTHIVNFGYFEDRNVWPIMGEIAVAERGRVFFDRNGLLKFWNRNRLHNRHSYIDLTLDDDIVDLDYSVQEHEIKNKIIVQATPRASAGVQAVWSSGNAEYLNPYTDTLVFIPANNAQLATLELEDPCTTFITPVPSVDYTANSAQDGSGDDLTNNITINEFINYGNAIFISVLNLGSTDAFLTKFQIRGNPAKILKWIRVTSTDDQSINAYGEQDYKIENYFIDSEGTAREIADEELYRRKDAINLFRVNIVGIPYLLCGDVVNVEHRNDEYKEFMISELNWSLDGGGFMQRLTLVNPYIFPIKVFISARANIVDALKEIQAKAKLTGAKIVLAKGSIKLETTRAVTSKGKVSP